MVSSSKLVATAIVIPNFKHSWACLGGAKTSQEALRGLEEPTVCTKRYDWARSEV